MSKKNFLGMLLFEFIFAGLAFLLNWGSPPDGQVFIFMVVGALVYEHLFSQEGENNA